MNFAVEPIGESWPQLAELGLALILSALIGLEREYRQKSAGLRTYTVVGVAAALMMLVSKYGFTDVLLTGRIVLDPSRVAAQVVTGIGFIGGGVIFMRRDVVRGLTTAAIVWLTAAVGMACGAGLPVLAIAVTAAHFVVVFVFPSLARRLPRARFRSTQLRLLYELGRGSLRDALSICTHRGFSVSDLSVQHTGDGANDVVNVLVTIQGSGDLEQLEALMVKVPGMLSVATADAGEPIERYE
ncbi:MAG TPA: MgtC/SapB family protein [Candidatus Baltobacteraceae bacterium]|nr:MgtC/SapB family protein [Candidatus Baltobacteraceae bacterium]